MNPASSSFARWRINFGISIALRGPISDGAMAYRDPAFFASPSAFVLRNCLSVRRRDPLYLDYRPVDYAGGGNRAVERSIPRRRRSHDRRGEGQHADGDAKRVGEYTHQGPPLPAAPHRKRWSTGGHGRAVYFAGWRVRTAIPAAMFIPWMPSTLSGCSAI